MCVLATRADAHPVQVNPQASSSAAAELPDMHDGLELQDATFASRCPRGGAGGTSPGGGADPKSVYSVCTRVCVVVCVCVYVHTVVRLWHGNVYVCLRVRVSACVLLCVCV